MTTDSGIDLVVYSDKGGKALTIQVKSKRQPVLSGGKGVKGLGWFLRDNSPADIIAVTDRATDRAWLFTMHEFRELAQQHSNNGMLQLYMYVESPARTKHQRVHVSDFDNYLLESKVHELFFDEATSTQASQLTRSGRIKEI